MNLFGLDFNFGELKELFKLRYLIAVTATTGTVLFAPESFIETMGLTNIREAARPWIGIVFLFTGILSTLVILIGLAKFVGDVLVEKREHKGRLDYLSSLTSDEKKVLGHFLRTNSKTAEFPVTSGIITGLQTRKIIYVSSTLGYTSVFMSPTDVMGQVNISDWAWDYLHENPELLSITDYDQSESLARS